MLATLVPLNALSEWMSRAISVTFNWQTRAVRSTSSLCFWSNSVVIVIWSWRKSQAIQNGVYKSWRFAFIYTSLVPNEARKEVVFTMFIGWNEVPNFVPQINVAVYMYALLILYYVDKPFYLNECVYSMFTEESPCAMKAMETAIIYHEVVRVELPKGIRWFAASLKGSQNVIRYHHMRLKSYIRMRCMICLSH